MAGQPLRPAFRDRRSWGACGGSAPQCSLRCETAGRLADSDSCRPCDKERVEWHARLDKLLVETKRMVAPMA
jgi:hypothetical protein